MSQLGMMVIAIGLSCHYLALYHLMNHAFYKGLLFLGAGSIIHAMSDNQDLRKYGGLILFLPVIYSVILIASFSLIAIPFLSGYYSKDLIIESLYSQHTFVGTSVYIISVLGAILTTLYSAKIIYLTFISRPNGVYNNYNKVHEGNVFMNVPLIILAIFSIFFGYITKDIYVGLGSGVFSDNSVFVHPLHEILIDTEFSLLPFTFSSDLNILGGDTSGASYFFLTGDGKDKVSILKFIPFILTLVSLILYVTISEYFNHGFIILKINKLVYYIYGLFNQRFFFEFIYNNYLVNTILNLGGHTIKILDKGSIELLGPVGVEKILFSVSKRITSLSKGIVTNYALYLIICAILYILIHSIVIYFVQLFFVIMYICLMIFQQKKPE
jgi:NADH-ubiquinone oxidoreductase chain 5